MIHVHLLDARQIAKDIRPFELVAFRIKLIELADKYGVPIIEDDPYGQLRFEGDHIPSLVSLDSKFRGKNGGCYSGNVIYLSTFSKLLSPGLRLAWVIAPEQVIRKLVMSKQAADLHTASFNQYVAYELSLIHI